MTDEIDLSGLDVFENDKMNEGIWITLELPDPKTGDLVPSYLNDDPAYPRQALVRSARCKMVRDAEEKINRDMIVRLRTAKRKDQAKVIGEATLDPEKRFALVLVALRNVGSSPGTSQVSEAVAKLLFTNTKYDPFKQQILEASNDDRSYGIAQPGGDDKENPPGETGAETLAEN